MKQLNEEALIALCIMFGFTLILATIFSGLSTEAQKQSLYQKTYDKSMECRITFKGRSQQKKILIVVKFRNWRILWEND